MFYRVWSGLTKYLRSVVLTARKPFEINDFAIFQPIFTSNFHKRSASDATAATSLNMKDIGMMSLGDKTNGFRNTNANKRES